jgi:hypothetical protein
MDYRIAAREALKRAKQELSNGDDHRLRYAALELRMALESLIYERAELYTEELPTKKLSIWQPKKLLSLLLEIDPDADNSTELRVGVQEELGKPATMMTSLGRDRVLSHGEVKRYYDRIGSYLHAPTLEQVAQGKGASYDTIRTRCSEISQIIEEVISSPIFNVNFRTLASKPCGKCGTKIVRRIPNEPNGKPIIAKCIECSASYSLTSINDKQVEWKPHIYSIKCANPSCDCRIKIWERDIKIGDQWVCSGCNFKNQFVIGLAPWSDHME